MTNLCMAGKPDEKDLYQRLKQLHSLAEEEGSRVKDDSWIHARYWKESWVPGDLHTLTPASKHYPGNLPR